jgi:hypothetical protein
MFKTDKTPKKYNKQVKLKERDKTQKRQHLTP